MTDDAPLLGGRYRLGARLGGGGMADVHRAMDTRLQRLVAAKVFRSATDELGRKRFAEEARILAGLSHPGLVTVHDFSADEDELFLIMELVEGGTLADVAETGPMQPEDVADIGGKLADVLAYVHGNDVVHRDVKPTNVLLSNDGRAFLADFGVSRLADAAGRLTDSGMVVGTTTYMAPEQVSGGAVGFPADVYALGLVLLECVTGRVEYPGGPDAAVARLVRSPQVPHGIPARLRRGLLAMLISDPTRRITAEQAGDLLSGRTTEVITPIPAPVVAPPPRVPQQRVQRPPTQSMPTQQPSQQRPVASIAAGVVVIAVVTVLAVVLWPDSSGTPELPAVSGPPGPERLPADLEDLERLVRG
ncbi:serine/threonine protein kinase [Saccharopolyspora rhizosphaerae]|uniref:non-specific serine/threonine protein kinase n=1 Tax=Saccharopolyspora rhizosphaerae TaxID=2492662 RepID=A0A3R8Q6T0_9PSEU|nr:serine/threonine-protein kinase [Saccharopolyspora rhizosphaerae]RRO18178.1 serine/threonine protein kinase [Saccharopolyspora rhizosphaerae]